MLELAIFGIGVLFCNDFFDHVTGKTPNETVSIEVCDKSLSRRYVRLDEE